MSNETLRSIASIVASGETAKRIDQFAGWEWVRTFKEPKIFRGASLGDKLIKTGFLGYFFQEMPKNEQEITKLLSIMGDSAFNKLKEWEKIYKIKGYNNWSKIRLFLLGNLGIKSLSISELRELNNMFGGWIGQLRANAITKYPDAYLAFKNETHYYVKHNKVPPNLNVNPRSVDALLTPDQKTGIIMMMNIGIIGHPDFRKQLDRNDSRIY